MTSDSKSTDWKLICVFLVYSKDEIDLPIKPEYNDTLEQEYYNHLETTRNNVFDIGSNRFYGGDKSPYQIARKEYETLLSSQSLWKVFGEERKVFDNKITLLEAEGEFNGSANFSRRRV